MRLPRHVGTLAVFGGTFDPVHVGHLVLAQELVDQQAAERVLFVPAGIPPHKAGEPVTPPEHRLAMVRLAIRGNAAFDASAMEIEKGGASFTIDTLRILRRRIPSRVRLALVVGADQAVEFETWRGYRELAKEFRLILTTRAGYPRDPRGGRRYLQSATLVDIPALELSSTDIRQRAAAGRSIRYLVPGRVEAYIRRHGLYQSAG